MELTDNKILIVAGLGILAILYFKGSEYFVDMFDQLASATFDFIFAIFGLVGDLLHAVF